MLRVVGLNDDLSPPLPPAGSSRRLCEQLERTLRGAVVVDI